MKRSVVMLMALLVMMGLRASGAHASTRWSKDLSGTWALSPYVVTANESDPAHMAGFTQGYYQPGFDDSSWQQTPVPLLWPRVDQWHAGKMPSFPDADPQDPIMTMIFSRAASWEHANSVVSAWYRTSFDLPAGSGRRCRINFGGVGTYCEVYLNGRKIGSHWGQLTPFSMDGSGAAVFGGKNVLAVFVRYDAKREDLQDSTEIYAGISRAVTVESLPDINVSDVLVDPLVSKGMARLRCFVGNGGRPRSVSIRASVSPLNGNGKIYQSFTKSVRSAAGVSEILINVPMPGAQRWSLTNPFMYKARVDLAIEGKTVDSTTTSFGYREFVVKGNKFLLNGVPFRLWGGVLNCNYWGGTGTTPRQDRLQAEYIVDGFLDAGQNVLRIPNLTTEEIMDAADNRGFLLYMGCSSTSSSDALDVSYLPAMHQNRLDFMRKYYNHPSIVMWHFANEKWDTAKVEEYNSIYRIARAFDTSGRPIVPASGSHSLSWLPARSVSGDAVDIHQYIGNSFMALGEEQRLPYSYTDACVGDQYGWLEKYYGLGFQMPVFYGESGAGMPWSHPDGVAYPDYPYLREDGTVDATYYAAMANPKDWNYAVAGFSEGARYVGLGAWLKDPRNADRSWQAKEPLNDTVHLIKRQIEILRSGGDRFAGVFMIWSRPIRECSGFPSLDTVQPREAGEVLFSPVSVALIQPALNVFVGEQAGLDYYVVNDSGKTLSPSSLEFRVGGLVATAKVPKIPPGGLHRGRVTIGIPANLGEGRHVLRMFVKQGTALVTENLEYLNVGRRPGKIAQTKRIGVWTPNGTAANSPSLSALTTLGLNYTKISTDLLPMLVAGQDILIIPSMCGLGGDWSAVDADFQTAGKDIRKFLEDGGTVLCLEQSVTGSIPWAPEWALVDRGPNEVIDPALTGHPVYEGLDRRSWLWPNGNHSRLTQVVIGPLSKHVVGGVCSHIDDLMYMAIAEAQVGKGHLIQSQVEMSSRFAYDSVAARYISNLLRYTLGQTEYGHVEAL